MFVAFELFWNDYDHGNGIKVRRLRELLRDKDLYHGKIREKLRE
jgi:hypothetical protein